MSQLHKKFTDCEVKKLIERYFNGQIKRNHLEKILGITSKTWDRLKGSAD